MVFGCGCDRLLTQALTFLSSVHPELCLLTDFERFSLVISCVPSRSLVLLVITAMIAQMSVNAQSKELSDQEIQEVDQAIDRAMSWIVSTQRRDGSFPTWVSGQPAVTSLAVLAMLAQGVQPEQGPEGKAMSQALDFVLAQQKPSGLIAQIGPTTKEIDYTQVPHKDMGHTAMYNHAISGLMLSELYGTTASSQAEQVRKAIEHALELTLKDQRRQKLRKLDEGGWRYLDMYGTQNREEADLSVVGWQLKFLRSSKNAGFDVPKQTIDQAVQCVRNHFDATHKEFAYSPESSKRSRAMTGAGILALAHSGMHNTEEARQAATSMLKFSFTPYNEPGSRSLDRYHYSLFQCTQAAYQLGDQYWQKFSPPVFRTLLANQNADGSWPVEGSNFDDHKFGRTYTTALAILTLSAPNQLLPIYQR